VRRLLLFAATAVGALALAPAGVAATRECDGIEVCVPVAGPWVALPAAATFPRPRVEWRLTCPRGYVVAGLDAELTERAIDVGFLGRLGSPVNPGISTARAVVFYASYVGATARAPSFRPHIGCMPAAGGGERIPTAASDIFRPGQPTTRRVRSERVRPGRRAVSSSCAAGETLVGASHAFGFHTRRPPSASLVAGVSGRRSVSGRRVSVSVRGDAELGSVRAVVQVHALCTRLR
jgi:hypothetical protein